MYKDVGASVVLVMGGSGDYFEVADHVIMMDCYLPRYSSLFPSFSFLFLFIICISLIYLYIFYKEISQKKLARSVQSSQSTWQMRVALILEQLLTGILFLLFSFLHF